MPVEIEAKMKVPDLDGLRARLQSAGAAFRHRVMESNTFFDTDDRQLLARDQGLRLRHTRDTQSQAETATITFKGPRLHGALKSREERELSVASVKDAMALFECLGYKRVITFQKRRESWKLDDCLVELGDLPYLGVFVEIEGPSEPAVLSVRRKLSLEDRALIRASYIALLTAHLQERGMNDRVIVFPADA